MKEALFRDITSVSIFTVRGTAALCKPFWKHILSLLIHQKSLYKYLEDEINKKSVSVFSMGLF